MGTVIERSRIGVIAKDGVITLTGVVDSYAKKAEAEDAAKSVKGVKAVVEKLEVKFDKSFGKKEDSEIASELIRVADWNSRIPKDKLKAKVEDGWVTLEGEVERNYQKEAAENIAANHSGVKGVTNNITIRETEDQADKKAIERALRRNLFVDDSNIKVDVTGHKLTLTGTVPSWYDKGKANGLPGMQLVLRRLKMIFRSIMIINWLIKTPKKNGGIFFLFFFIIFKTISSIL